MKITQKVRAVVIDRKGRAQMMAANADHVLQLPGGGIKPGEDPRKGIIREVGEETGYRRIEIIKATEPKVFKRAKGVYEVTVAFLVRVAKPSKPKLTGRERARGLRVVRFATAAAAAKALKVKVRRYGRSAARRDLALILELTKTQPAAAR